MNNYARGRNFEYRIKNKLIKAGFFVIRAAQSKGEADLVAIKQGLRPLMIQCKIGKTWSSISEWNEFLNLARNLDCIPIAATTYDRKTKIMLMNGYKPNKEEQISVLIKDLSALEAIVHLRPKSLS